MNQIPEEHQLECGGCGEILDKRDPSILSHGWIEDGFINCYDYNPEDGITYTSSKRVGDHIQWTKDKKPLNLN